MKGTIAIKWNERWKENMDVKRKSVSPNIENDYYLHMIELLYNYPYISTQNIIMRFEIIHYLLFHIVTIIMDCFVIISVQNIYTL